MDQAETGSLMTAIADDDAYSAKISVELGYCTEREELHRSLSEGRTLNDASRLVVP
jgi:hypothetical protein